MKFIAIVLVVSLQLSGFSVHAQEFDKEKAVAEAKGTVKTFAGVLKGELIAAMQAGGPLNALGVCNIEAMPITAKTGLDRDAQLSRVSLNNRNPDNAPNDWQRAVLEDFDIRAANGEDIGKMASVEVVDKDGKKQLRFMKAMPTGSECLACHGRQISGDVSAKLNELYPDDKATGYSPGDVRGAIVVVKDY